MVVARARTPNARTFVRFVNCEECALPGESPRRLGERLPIRDAQSPIAVLLWIQRDGFVSSPLVFLRNPTSLRDKPCSVSLTGRDAVLFCGITHGCRLTFAGAE